MTSNEKVAMVCFICGTMIIVAGGNVGWGWLFLFGVLLLY